MKKFISLALTLAMLFTMFVPAYAATADLTNGYMEFSFESSDWIFSGEDISANADSNAVVCGTFNPRDATYKNKVFAGDYVLTGRVSNNGGGGGNMINFKIGNLTVGFGGDKNVYYSNSIVGSYGANGSNSNFAIAYSQKGALKIYSIQSDKTELIYELEDSKLKDLSDGNFKVNFSWAAGAFYNLKMYAPYGDAFEDDFEEDVVNNWKFTDGAYSVSDGKLVASEDDIAYVKTIASGPYSVSADLTSADGDENAIYFNKITDDNFYAIKILGDSVCVVKDTSDTEIASATAETAVTSVRVDYSNENAGDIEVYVNNASSPLIETSDTSYLLGMVGVKLATTSSADNFALEVIDNSPEGKLKKAIKLFNKNKTADKLSSMVNDHYELLGIDIDDFNALPEETKAEIIASSVSELAGTATAKDISNAVVSKIAFELLSETGDIEVLTKYQSYMEFSEENYYEDWLNFTDEERSAICLKLKGSEDLADMMAKLESNVIIKALKYTAWSGLEEKLAFYGDNISLDMSKVNALNSEAKKQVFTAFKAKLENGDVADIKNINSILDALADEYEDYGEDSDSSRPSSSKKTSGGGGGTYTAPVTKVEPEATEIAKLPFVDIENIDWALTPIVKLWQDGIVNGKNGNEFAPYDDITREEFVAIVVRALKLTSNGVAVDFEDVSPERWSADAIAAALQNGIVSGMGNGKFAPDAKITRQDMAVIIHNAAVKFSSDFEENSTLSFSDKEDIADYAVNAVGALSKANLFNGANGKFNPLNNANRAEAATVIYRLLQMINK